MVPALAATVTRVSTGTEAPSATLGVRVTGVASAAAGVVLAGPLEFASCATPAVAATGEVASGVAEVHAAESQDGQGQASDRPCGPGASVDPCGGSDGRGGGEVDGGMPADRLR